LEKDWEWQCRWLLRRKGGGASKMVGVARKADKHGNPDRKVGTSGTDIAIKRGIKIIEKLGVRL
jgi:hypothetical protein